MGYSQWYGLFDLIFAVYFSIIAILLLLNEIKVRDEAIRKRWFQVISLLLVTGSAMFLIYYLGKY